MKGMRLMIKLLLSIVLILLLGLMAISSVLIKVPAPVKIRKTSSNYTNPNNY